LVIDPTNGAAGDQFESLMTNSRETMQIGNSQTEFMTG
jgi:hypothetical protein